MTEQEHTELVELVGYALDIYGDCDDQEVGPIREKDITRICELLDRIKINKG